MNPTPFYTLAIDVTIKGLRDADDIVMRCMKIVPFVPMNGMAVELWCDDLGGEEGKFRIQLENVYYSFSESTFIEEHDDNDLIETLRAGQCTSADKEELLNWYKAFGFARLNYPVAQVVRSATGQ